MRQPNNFSSHTPYLAWLVFSGAVLGSAWAADPYLFGFAAFGAAAISAILVVLSMVSGWRSFAWGIAGAVPTGIALILLSTVRWA